MGKKRKGFKLKEGSLTGLGYHTTNPAKSRHRALNKALKRYGYTKTVRKLVFLVGPARLTKTEKRKVRADLNWLKRQRGRKR